MFLLYCIHSMCVLQWSYFEASLQIFRGFSGDLSELSMGLNRMDSSLLQSPSDGEMHLQDV